MSITDLVTAVMLSAGAFFFLAGTVGLLRFPDTPSRLHAITKADNLGLGFIIVGLVVQSSSLATSAKLLIVWLLVLTASSTSCYLIAQFADRHSLSRRP
jgi:multicomponent Na+:H+ antiporter subunit G